jgi:hypothetical protein
MVKSDLAAPAEAFNAYVECTLVPHIDNGGFTLSVIDHASGVVIGRRNLPSRCDGKRPPLTVADAIEMVGGFYRFGNVQMDLICRVLDTTGPRFAKRVRRRKRSFHLAQLRQAAN